MYVSVIPVTQESSIAMFSLNWNFSSNSEKVAQGIRKSRFRSQLCCLGTSRVFLKLNVPVCSAVSGGSNPTIKTVVDITWATGYQKATGVEGVTGALISCYRDVITGHNSTTVGLSHKSYTDGHILMCSNPLKMTKVLPQISISHGSCSIELPVSPWLEVRGGTPQNPELPSGGQAPGSTGVPR